MRINIIMKRKSSGSSSSSDEVEDTIFFFGKLKSGVTKIFNKLEDISEIERLKAPGLGNPRHIYMLDVPKYNSKLLFYDMPEERINVQEQNTPNPCECIIVVYDVTNRESFNKAKEFVELSIKLGMTRSILILANKCDLPNRVISQSEGAEYAAAHKSFYMDYSAERDDVRPLFNKIMEIYAKVKTKVRKDSQGKQPQQA